MEHAGFEQGLVHGSLQSAKYNRQRGNVRGAIIQSDDYSSAYHVYAIEWRPGKIDFYFDDTLYFSQGIDIAEEGYDAWAAWPFDKPFHLILNIAVGGDWGGYKGVDEGIWPQTLAVDWVRVWDLGLDPAKDTKKPGPPSAPRLYASASGYTLDWLPSRDNYGIDEYRVYMDGELIGGGAKNMIALSMLVRGENRVFRIEARDYNGNASSGGEFALSAQ
jgi:beta-glucanase (GH16 family)